MKIENSNLNELASMLMIERKRQGLSREDAAAVCGVSASFIRDAESRPENCSLGKMAKLINGLGFSLQALGVSRGISVLKAEGLNQANFAVPQSQQVPTK